MGALLIFFIIFCVLFFTLSWILPMIISWHFEKKYEVSLKIGRIGLPYLKLCDIHLSKNGFNIHIDEIGIKSSFLNSDLTKLITLVVKDVRINKDLSTKITEDTSVSSDNIADFRDRKVPHFINSFAQFMAVHVYNISAILLRSETPGCLVHATARELHLDGSILKNAKSLLVTLNLMEAEIKVLRHAEQQVKEARLAEFSFGISLETILVVQGPLSVEKLHIKMSQSSAVINGAFYNIAHNPNSKYVKKTLVYNNYKEDDIVQRFRPIIPKNCALYIDDTSLTGVRDNGQIEYNSSLKSLALNYRSVLPEEKNGLGDKPSVLFNFYLAELLLLNSREKLVELKHFNVDAKVPSYTNNIGKVVCVKSDIYRINNSYCSVNNIGQTKGSHDVSYIEHFSANIKNHPDKSENYSALRNNMIIASLQNHYSLSVTQIIKQLSLETETSPNTILKVKQEGTSSGITHQRKPKNYRNTLIQEMLPTMK